MSSIEPTPQVSDVNDKHYKNMQEAQTFFKNAIEACMGGKIDELTDMFTKYIEKYNHLTILDIVTDFQSEGKNLIHIAASSGHLSIIKYFVDSIGDDAFKALVNLKDKSGSTPLIYATIAESGKL